MVKSTLSRAGRLVRFIVASPQASGYASGPVSVILIWVLRSAGLIVDRPVWVYVVLVVAGSAVTTTTNLMYERRPTRLILQLQLVAAGDATSLVIYSTGWGPAIIVCYAFSAMLLIAATQPSTWRLAVAWNCFFVGLGQIGIALGWVPSFLPFPMEHGAAALGIVALVYVTRMAATTAAVRDGAVATLRASEERFRSLVQNSSDLIVVIDANTRPTYVSRASRSLLGLTEDELIAANLVPLIHPDDLERVGTRFSAARGSPGLPNLLHSQ